MVTNVWCGYDLTDWQKEMLTDLTMKEFEKPVHKRQSAYMLVNLIKTFN